MVQTFNEEVKREPSIEVRDALKIFDKSHKNKFSENYLREIMTECGQEPLGPLLLKM